MPVNNVHPNYNDRIHDWQMIRTCAFGERWVKLSGILYLPMPSGFAAQADRGGIMYAAYQNRAMFPDLLAPTLRGMVGVIHRQAAEISGLEDGKPLHYMLDKATKDGMPLDAFHRRATAEILLMGRYGILTDVNPEGGEPYLAGYDTEMIINWNNLRADLFVLDESAMDHRPGGDEFAWVHYNRWRVLRYDPVLGYTVQTYEQDMKGEPPMSPSVRGGKAPMTEIPFVLVGPRDLTFDPEEAPLIGVAKSSLAIYRLDADYRHQLYNSGQETLFVTGLEERQIPKAFGAGICVSLPKDCTAAFVAPTGRTIDAHRQAIRDERQNAISAGARLFEEQKTGVEAAEALRLRQTAQQATLTSVALASAAALEKALRYAAMFVGQDPDEIIVKPNLKFTDTVMTTSDAVNLVTIWQAGAISQETLYEDLQRGEIASAEREFEDEKKIIDQELADQPVPPTILNDNPFGSTPPMPPISKLKKNQAQKSSVNKYGLPPKKSGLP